MASYYVWQGSNLTYISNIFRRQIPDILRYNPAVPNPDSIRAGSRINVPFSCECLNGEFLGHTFQYITQPDDTYGKVARVVFANLTTVDWVIRVNVYDPAQIPSFVPINVTVNCSCGDGHLSNDYGLFVTYPLRPGENLSSLAAESGVPAELLQRFNPGSDFGAGTGPVFVPARDQNGTFPQFKSSSSGISGGVIAGLSVAGVAGALFLAACFYVVFYRRKKVVEGSLLHTAFDDKAVEHRHGPGSNLEKTSEPGPIISGASPGLTGITVDKSVEFSYEELAMATNDFSMANKIGQGGFGSVYYAELRGEKAAIKKMDMQASKEFLAELKVLTHVHHLNLVRLIGYCVEGSLFLVYEFIENGNLGQHLRGSGNEPLPWSSRVQIALDSARGLEYIHEHTVPVYIHRDIKSANILIDKNFRAKVADFGLTKLTEVGSASLHTRLVGTFGYMPPEYARYGDVSPKIDVYAFGVVLYELISAKEAIVKTNEVITESQGLVSLFESILNQPDPREDLCKLVDPRLGDDYHLDSVRKMAYLAKACTQENPQLRPSMRSMVVALMTLSSSTDDWDVGFFYENQGLVNLMSGSGECNALASYYVRPGSNLTFISKILSSPISEIHSYNREITNPEITNPDYIVTGSRVNVPFSCGCVQGEFMGHQFVYNISPGDSYQLVAQTYYANLTTIEMLQRFNTDDTNNKPGVNGRLNVTINCSCGNSNVSKEYGLFITYPLRPDENLSTVSNQSGVSEQLLLDYNPNSNFSSGSGLVFIPGRDQTGTFPRFRSSSRGISAGVISGLSVAGVAGALFFAACFYVVFYKRKKAVEGSFLHTAFDDNAVKHRHGRGSNLEKTSESSPIVGGASLGLTGITVDKSVEFSYEELAKATNDFSMASKIGQGGFGSVYYAELRGEKAAIKKMDMQASKEFLAELKVLTRVHHLNLVHLIGYCVEGSLFLIYEFIENGNLGQHLRGSGKDPLPWSTRVQIALDSARGLEYIHEHTIPVCIHRDIKSANILLDKNFRAKVADFGLTKLTGVGSSSLHTGLVGTFGYMPPECARYGSVSPKIDVYAFGVVLYELISAKEAVVKTNEAVTESQGLAGLFEAVLSQPDPREDLCKLIDPRLGDDYPLDSVRKMAYLANACTQENSQLRPSMRSIVVALMTLASSTDDWDVGSFYANQGLVNLMSGR
ncbi:hypothetical protein F0562_018842 [Nyssa sinensis]|uniref:non-specific serine/threonine protein kinase n=1 Tax=Nyssa sinensis TaxID=561372 RepID=A0A5J4ZE11_9ASTE|nr:hypothetical protein F0562_018842 [Nyssa sinensis]